MQSLKKQNTQETDTDSNTEDLFRHPVPNNEQEVEIVQDIVAVKIKPTESESHEVLIENESNRNDEQWIYCELCVYKCKTIKTMTKHNTTMHESEITCNICGKMFRTTSTLEEHTKAENEVSQGRPSEKTQK